MTAVVISSVRSRRWSPLLVGALFALIALLMLVPNIAWPYHDAAIFSVIGEGIWRGDLPYRDLWDHKPPGIYVVASLGWPVLWVASGIAIAATGMLLRAVSGTYTALVAVVCLALYPVALGGGQTETFAALPTAAAVVSGVQRRWLTAGICTAMALLFSFQFAALPVAMLLMGGRTRFAVGLTATALGALVALGIAGILPAAIDALVLYGRVYLQSSRANDLEDAWHLGLALIPLAFGIQYRRTRLDASMAIWVALGILLFVVQGRLLGHYATALVIPLAVLSRDPSSIRRRSMIVAVGLALVLSLMASRAYAQRGPATVEIANWIRSRTDASQTILVWGVDANIYLESDRAPAGRYPYLIPLVTHNYTTPRMIRDWVESLRRESPTFIVDSEAANEHWPDGHDFLRPPPPGAAGGRDLDLVEPLRDFVRENYRFVTEIEGRKIWQLQS